MLPVSTANSVLFPTFGAPVITIVFTLVFREGYPFIVFLHCSKYSRFSLICFITELVRPVNAVLSLLYWSSLVVSEISFVYLWSNPVICFFAQFIAPRLCFSMT